MKLKWNEKEAEEEISCIDFQHSSKESLNEFVKELSKKLIKKHFSGTLLLFIYNFFSFIDIVFRNFNILQAASLHLPFVVLTIGSYL